MILKNALIVFAMLLSTAALADHRDDVAGYYAGTCLAQYAGTQAAPCQMTMNVDYAAGVVVYGNSTCISPTDFYGLLEGSRADLRSGGWAAQPQGQTLALNFLFDRRTGEWSANGSGYGIADRKWSYRCAFRRQ